MKDKFVSIGLVEFIIIGGFLSLTMFKPVVAEASTFYVGGTSPGNYSKIQWAIDDASDGDTVYVFSGRYHENVVVNKSISMIGEDKNTTVIDGEGNGDVVYLGADGVNITGFTFTNGGDDWGDAGILVDSANNLIHGNKFINNRFGLYDTGDANNNSIFGNEFSNNEYGIFLNCDWNSIPNNTVINNEYGIYLSNPEWNNINNNSIYYNICGIFVRSLFWRSMFGENNTIIHNNASYNQRGIRLLFSSRNNITTNECIMNAWYGISLTESENNTIIGNNISSNNMSGIYISRSSNNNITYNDAYSNFKHGIALFGSDNNVIANNLASQNNEYGIEINNSDQNHLIGNNASLNKMSGVYLWYSSGNNIIGNIVNRNNNDGIHLFDSSNNNISENYISSNNGAGIYVDDDSRYCTIDKNRVENHTINVYIDSDRDGVPDELDLYPDDPMEWADRDGDGHPDNSDVFPDDPDEWSDLDEDGRGDNSDPDKTGNYIPDILELPFVICFIIFPIILVCIPNKRKEEPKETEDEKPSSVNKSAKVDDFFILWGFLVSSISLLILLGAIGNVLIDPPESSELSLIAAIFVLFSCDFVLGLKLFIRGFQVKERIYVPRIILPGTMALLILFLILLVSPGSFLFTFIHLLLIVLIYSEIYSHRKGKCDVSVEIAVNAVLTIWLGYLTMGAAVVLAFR